MKNKHVHAIGIAVVATSLLMSFAPQKNAYTVDAKKITNTNLNTAMLAQKPGEQAFTPLVTIALAENTAAAVVVATASIIGYCDSQSFVKTSVERLNYLKMKNLDK